MLLAVDIGNTNIKMALFEDKRILRSWKLTTDKKGTLNQYKKALNGLFVQQKIKKEIKVIIICSVVPRLTLLLQKVLLSLFKVKPLILGKDIIAPIKNLYKRPKQVGQDRLVNATGAFNKYGGPVIVVDFGTALTFDVVSTKGSYLGGIIVPGMELGLRMLISNAEMLPKINLAKPRMFLGRDTASSMKSGLVYGYSFLVEGILRRLQEKFKPRAQVVATGGEAALMAGFCRSIDRIDQNLTLEGLIIVYNAAKTNKNVRKLIKIS